MKYLETYNIYEALKGKEYARNLNPNDLQNYLDRFCKDFSWDDKPIYRAFYSTKKIKNSDVMLYNPKAIDRVSANTKNYYTLLFDNSPYRNNFPKRSKSLICSTNYYNTIDYGDIFRVIPFDDAKIAICDSEDFWVSFHLEKYGIYSLDDFNTTLEFLYELLTGKKLIENYDILVKQINKMMLLFNKLNKDKFEKMKLTNDYFKIWNWKDIKNFPKSLDEIYKMLDPIKNDMKLYNYNNYKKIELMTYENNEVWTDSKSILIKESYI